MGFSDFRVRVMKEDNGAKLQVTKRDFERLMEKREEVLKHLKNYFDVVTLDLELR